MTETIMKQHCFERLEEFNTFKCYRLNHFFSTLTLAGTFLFITLQSLSRKISSHHVAQRLHAPHRSCDSFLLANFLWVVGSFPLSVLFPSLAKIPLLRLLLSAVCCSPSHWLMLPAAGRQQATCVETRNANASIVTALDYQPGALGRAPSRWHSQAALHYSHRQPWRCRR
jgi:hypothetical protein